METEAYLENNKGKVVDKHEFFVLLAVQIKKIKDPIVTSYFMASIKYFFIPFNTIWEITIKMVLTRFALFLCICVHIPLHRIFALICIISMHCKFTYCSLKKTRANLHQKL